LALFEVFDAISVQVECSSPGRFAKISFGGSFTDLENRRDAIVPFLGAFENRDPPVVQTNFKGFPILIWVEPVWVKLIGIPGTIEPIEIGLFVRDPFLDGLPGRLDRLHGFDVEMRRCWTWVLDDSLPKAVEAEKELDLPGEFDLLGALDDANEFHGSTQGRDGTEESGGEVGEVQEL
jgi:hypothetical protein